MISIVICSRQSVIPEWLLQNIQSTIGVDYEIVWIDNSGNQYTIFQAYNDGVRRAKGEVLCFMHEDVIFRSQSWGTEVSDIFRDKSIGLIGVIGCQFLSNRVQPWWTLGHHLGCVTQGHYKGDMYSTFLDGKPLNQRLADGVAVDGLWFCIRRDLFAKIWFDEQTFDHFHCYDVDTCMQVLQNGYRVVVAGDIHLEHKSGGQVSEKYYEQLGKFVAKWRRQLPISRGLGWGKIGTIIYQWYRNKDNR